MPRTGTPVTSTLTKDQKPYAAMSETELVAQIKDVYRQAGRSERCLPQRMDLMTRDELRRHLVAVTNELGISPTD